MDGKLVVALAVAAGFVGGVASHYAIPFPVSAQTAQLPAPAQGQVPSVPSPQVVRSQSFQLTDDHGNALAAFGAVVTRIRIGGPGGPTVVPSASVVLRDSRGMEIWRAPAAPQPLIRPLTRP